MDEQDHVAALREAIRIAGGSQDKLAAKIATFMKRSSFGQRTVSYWLTNGVLLEAKWWPAIEHATKGKVTRKQLRPDVFGKQRGRAA